jgi:hypothetical protein
MNLKRNTNGIIGMAIIASALIGAIAADIYHTEVNSAPKPLSQNEMNAAQNAFCLEAGMKPILEDGKVVCSPDRAVETIRDFWESDLGKEVIREKLRQQGYVAQGSVNWPADEPLPIKSFKKPVNPNSFETKVKVTE